MPNLKQQLQEALKDAMKAKDRERRDAIRLLQSAIKQVEIDERTSIGDEAVLDILRREAKSAVRQLRNWKRRVDWRRQRVSALNWLLLRSSCRVS